MSLPFEVRYIYHLTTLIIIIETFSRRQRTFYVNRANFVVCECVGHNGRISVFL